MRNRRVCTGGTVIQTAEQENTASRCRATMFGRLAAACTRKTCGVSRISAPERSIYAISVTFVRNLYPYIRFEPSWA